MPIFHSQRNQLKKKTTKKRPYAAKEDLGHRISFKTRFRPSCYFSRPYDLLLQDIKYGNHPKLFNIYNPIRKYSKSDNLVKQTCSLCKAYTHKHNPDKYLSLSPTVVFTEIRK